MILKCVSMNVTFSNGIVVKSLNARDDWKENYLDDAGERPQYILSLF